MMTVTESVREIRFKRQINAYFLSYQRQKGLSDDSYKNIIRISVTLHMVVMANTKI